MADFLSSAADDSGAPEVPAKRGRGRPKGSGKGAGKESSQPTIKLTPRELTEMLLVPAMLFVSRLKLPEEAKPLREEVEGFVLPLCSIVLRHSPPIKASADALDVVKLVFAGLHYYQRVSPILAAEKARASQPEFESEAQYDREEESEAPSGSNGNGRWHTIEPAPARVGLY